GGPELVDVAFGVVHRSGDDKTATVRAFHQPVHGRQAHLGPALEVDRLEEALVVGDAGVDGEDVGHGLALFDESHQHPAHVGGGGEPFDRVDVDGTVPFRQRDVRG